MKEYEKLTLDLVSRLTELDPIMIELEELEERELPDEQEEEYASTFIDILVRHKDIFVPFCKDCNRRESLGIYTGKDLIVRAIRDNEDAQRKTIGAIQLGMEAVIESKNPVLIIAPLAVAGEYFDQYLAEKELGDIRGELKI